MPSAFDLIKNLIKKATAVSMPTRRPKRLEAPKEEVKAPVAKTKPATKKAASTSTKKKPATTKAKTTKTAKTATPKKTVEKKASTTKVTTKTTAKKEVKKTVAKAPVKKAATKKSATTSSTTTKKVATKKAVTPKKTTKATKTVKEKKAPSTKKVATRKKTINPVSNMVEYYDLPYRYNLTNITVLAQNPETLFVYWDISDEDRLRFVNEFGEHFFDDTYPVLIIHNLTTGRSKEIAIDDFANNWYIDVENSKCKYRVELGRRPKQHQSTVTKEYLNVTDSNTIEIPNDHVLFFKNYDMIYFTNVKTGQKVGKIINLQRDQAGINAIYKAYDLEEFGDVKDRFDFSNPSSHSSSHS